MSDQPHNYGIEPDGTAPEANPAAPVRPPDVERPAAVEPLPIEDDEVPPSARSVKELDVCPNCGASMRNGDTLVCLRCGFDLKTSRVLKTKIAAPKPVDEDEEIASTEPLVSPGRGDIWLPAALAIICGGILLVAYLAGARGLFPRVVDLEAIPWRLRLQGLLQMIVLVGLWTGCGIGALYFLANLVSRRLGDLKLAAVRMLGIIAAIRLVSLTDLQNKTFEWIVEALLQAGVFVLLSMGLFNLKPRDAATLAAAIVILVLTLWLGAYVVVWVVGSA